MSVYLFLSGRQFELTRGQKVCTLPYDLCGNFCLRCGSGPEEPTVAGSIRYWWFLAILAAGWYLNTGMTTAKSVFAKVSKIDTTQQQTSIDIQTLQDKVTGIEKAQKDAALSLQKVGTQLSTLQAVLVNKLDLILPQTGLGNYNTNAVATIQ